MTTPFHSKYWASELTLRAAAGSIESLSRSIAGAALFALRSPLTKGVVLADEVGLGKTIEAGIVIAQRWAERRRRILLSKFYLSTAVLDSKIFNDLVTAGDAASFRDQFVRAADERQRNTALRDRRRPICIRTLRKQVVEYTLPDTPNSRLQNYRLTEKGRQALRKHEGSE